MTGLLTLLRSPKLWMAAVVAALVTLLWVQNHRLTAQLATSEQVVTQLTDAAKQAEKVRQAEEIAKTVMAAAKRDAEKQSLAATAALNAALEEVKTDDPRAAECLDMPVPYRLVERLRRPGS